MAQFHFSVKHYYLKSNLEERYDCKEMEKLKKLWIATILTKSTKLCALCFFAVKPLSNKKALHKNVKRS